MESLSAFSLIKGPRILDGAYATLVSALATDAVHVWLSGRSTVDVTQGIPEGGALGPLLYNLVPDSLVRYLCAQGHGLGLGIVMPSEWKSHVWVSSGVPQGAIVADIRARLSAGGRLPPAFFLASHPDVEASAARALDLEAGSRLPCIFHADDPVFLSSSRGAMQALLDDVCIWANSVGAAFHVAANKTVCMVITDKVVHHDKVLFYDGTPLAGVARHRWLGVLWPSCMDFTCFLLQRVQVASVAVSQLAGFASSSALPWFLVCVLFESKVDGILAFGRWLFILCPDAPAILDECYGRWAKLLLGADFWRNPGTCSSELGWTFSGFGRVVVSVAMRRATICCALESDWHASFFSLASDEDGSWATRSSCLLAKWGILDWSAWSCSPKTLTRYRSYVRTAVAQASISDWQTTVRRHRSSIPYYEFEASPGLALPRLLSVELSSSSHFKVRSWCRLRCVLLRLAHTRGKFSEVRYQDCIWCGCSTRKPLVHCLSLCSHWCRFRASLERSLGLQACDGHHTFSIRCLRSDIGVQALRTMVEWAADIDSGEHAFWNS